MRKKKLKPFEIESNRCWNCGKEFDEDKTKHHAIPHTFKPVINVLIPVCIKCHRKMNKDLTHIASLKTKILGLEKYVNQLKEMMK